MSDTTAPVQTILVVDDTPLNVKLLADLLAARVTARSRRRRAPRRCKSCLPIRPTWCCST